jgi:hypothetical protein
LKASVLQERVDGVLGLLKCWSLEASSVNLLSANGNTESADGSRGCCGAWSVLWWSSEKLNVQRRQAPFAHHRGQVGDVGYAPQRLFTNSWDALLRNIRCVHLGTAAPSLKSVCHVSPQ